LKDGSIRSYSIKPEDFDLASADIGEIQVDGVEQSLAMIKLVFAGESGAARDIVCLNAGAAIYVAGLADSHQDGIAPAQKVIDDGAASRVLDNLVAATAS
jgi:anthranilate phosphoribosyltransferase